MEVGGALPESARKALQMIPLPFVASTRADPFERAGAPNVPLTESPTATPVPNKTVAPAATFSEVALGSFTAAPPAGPKTSTPTRMALSVVLVQAKKVSIPPPHTPGTDQRWKDDSPWSVGGAELIWACAPVEVQASARTDSRERNRGMGLLLFGWPTSHDGVSATGWAPKRRRA